MRSWKKKGPEICLKNTTGELVGAQNKSKNFDNNNFFLHLVQPEEGATYDKIWKKKSVAQIDWNQPGKRLHDFIRGNDKLPGGWSTIEGKEVTFFGSQMYHRKNRPTGTDVRSQWIVLYC